MLKEIHVQAWIVVHVLINGYGRTQPGCRDDLLAFLFQLSYCKVRNLDLPQPDAPPANREAKSLEFFVGHRQADRNLSEIGIEFCVGGG